MRVLVIGSAGHIGRHLVANLHGRGHHVFEVDREPDFREDFWCVDIRDGIDLEQVFHETTPEVVYNLAGMVSRVTCEVAKQAAVRANVDGALAVAALAARHGARLIHYSTSEVYGPNAHPMRETDQCQPVNWYGMTKLLGDYGVIYLCEESGLDACAVRPFMLYHEDELAQDNRSAMIRFVRDVCEGREFELHDGTWRNWLHMDDAVDFMARIAELPEIPRIMNLGSPDVRSMMELVRIIGEKAGVVPVFQVVPCPERITPFKRPDLTVQLDLGMVPKIAIEEGVARVVAAYKERMVT